MLATPESVDSSRASPESGVFAAEVLVLDPSLGNENSPARKQIKSIFLNDHIPKLYICNEFQNFHIFKYPTHHPIILFALLRKQVQIIFRSCFPVFTECVLGEWRQRPSHKWALYGGEWWASCSDHFNRGDKVSGTHWMKASWTLQLVWMQW